MNWQRVADVVRARRRELRLTQQDAVIRAGSGVSLAVWNNLENARQESYRPSTLAAVARALNWTVDSIDRVLAGEHPIENGQPTDVIEAIQNDPRLDDQGKRILIGTYKTLVAGGPDDGEALA
jgi:transcriptional regulator with XRE-family HTH domain